MIAHLLLLLLISSSWAVSADEPRFERLPCGARVCLQTQPDAPLAVVQLWFTAGSSLDHPRVPGMADTIRHIKLAMGAPMDPIWRETSATLHDATFIALLVPQADLPAALRRMTDRLALGGARFLKPRFASEDSLQQPDPLLTELLGAHPYARPATLRGAWPRWVSWSGIYAHEAQWFAPASVTIFVSGDFDADATLAALRDLTSGLPPGTPPVAAPLPQIPDGFVDRTSDAVIEPGAALEVVWVVRGAPGPGGLGVELALDCLGAAEGPLLRQDGPLGGWSATWSLDQRRFAGIARLRVTNTGSARMSARAAAQHVQAAREALAAQPVSERLFDGLRARASARAARVRADALGRAVDDARHEIVAGDIRLTQGAAQRPLLLQMRQLQRGAQLLGAARWLAAPLGAASLSEEAAQRADSASAPQTMSDPQAASAPAIASAPVPRLVQVDVLAALHDGAALRIASGGQGWACVRTRVRVVRRTLEDLLGGLEVEERQRIERYIWHYGLSLQADDQAEVLTLVSAGPSGRAAALIELHARVLRNLADGAQQHGSGVVNVFVAGDVNHDEAQAAFLDAWGPRVSAAIAVGNAPAPGRRTRETIRVPLMSLQQAEELARALEAAVP